MDIAYLKMPHTLPFFKIKMYIYIYKPAPTKQRRDKKNGRKKTKHRNQIDDFCLVGGPMNEHVCEGEREGPAHTRGLDTTGTLDVPWCVLLKTTVALLGRGKGRTSATHRNIHTHTHKTKEGGRNKNFPTRALPRFRS